MTVFVLLLVLAAISFLLESLGVPGVALGRSRRLIWTPFAFFLIVVAVIVGPARILFHYHGG
jgi:hypothetical protein